MKQVLMFLFMSAVFFGCGVVNNLGVIGKNITRAVSSHPYEVEEGKEAEILASGMAIVDLDVENTGTAWIRMSADGVIEDKNYTLTYNEAGARGRRQSQLPEGTYILNGVIINDQGMSGYYARSSGNMENFGWDEEKQQPKCFSFTLKAGELLYIPTLISSYQEDTICPLLKFKDESEVTADATYKIWDESK